MNDQFRWFQKKKKKAKTNTKIKYSFTLCTSISYALITIRRTKKESVKRKTLLIRARSRVVAIAGTGGLS